MGKSDSTAVTAFINSVRQDMDGNYLKEGTNRAPVERPAMPGSELIAGGDPLPSWSEPPPTRARGTLPPPIPDESPALSPAAEPAAAAASELDMLEPELLEEIEPELLEEIEPELLEEIEPEAAQLIEAPTPMPMPAQAAAAPPAAHAKPKAQDRTVPTSRVAIDPSDDHWFEHGDNADTSALEMIAVDWHEFSPADVSVTDARGNLRPARRSWLLPAVGAALVAGGVGIAAIIAFSGGGSDKIDAKVTNAANQHQPYTAPSAAPIATPATAIAAPAAVAIAPVAVAAEPLPAVAAEPAIIDPSAIPAAAPGQTAPAAAIATDIVLRQANFDSVPSGASVTLIMNGKPIPLGAAPIDAQLDPTKSYEVMFTLPGHTTALRTVSFDGTGAIAVGAALRVSGQEIAVAAIAAPLDEAIAARGVAEPEVVEPEIAEPAPAKKISKRKRAKRKRSSETKRRRKARTAARSSKSSLRNKGVLMLNAKPPCEVYVDGKKRGMTPQRALKLSPGKHKIKLINRQFRIKKTFTVRIKKGKKTRVIKDLTGSMRRRR